MGVWSYEYDLNGNLISQSGGGGNLVTGDSYFREYNGLGQLKSVKEGNNSNGRILEEYSYDVNGDRIKVIRYSYTGGTNETIYTPYKDWMQIRNSSGTFNFYYVYQDGILVSRLNPDGTKWFYHADHLGSTTLITDESGNVIENEFYSPFGESLNSNINEDFKLYTGQFKDSTGQYYYGARYYLPDIGKFVQPDTLIQDFYDPQTLNRYTYTRNNPYLYVDEDGNAFWIPPAVGFIHGLLEGGYHYYKTGDIKSSVKHGATTFVTTTTSLYLPVTRAGSGLRYIGGAGLKLFGVGAADSLAHSYIDNEDFGSLETYEKAAISGSWNTFGGDILHSLKVPGIKNYKPSQFYPSSTFSTATFKEFLSQNIISNTPTALSAGYSGINSILSDNSNKANGGSSTPQGSGGSSNSVYGPIKPKPTPKPPMSYPNPNSFWPPSICYCVQNNLNN